MSRTISGLFLALVLSASALGQAKDDLTPLRSSSLDFEVMIPAGWDRIESQLPIIARFAMKKEAATPLPLKGGGFMIEHDQFGQPKVLDAHADLYLANVLKKLEGYEDRGRKAADAGGCPAVAFSYTCTAEKPKTAGVTVLVQRQPKEIFTITAWAEGSAQAGIDALVARIVASFKPALGLSADLEADLAKSAKVFGAEKMRPALCSEEWHILSAGGQPIGFQHTKVSAAKLPDGKEGYALEIDLTIMGSNGAMLKNLSKGVFSPDLSYQDVQFTAVIEGPKTSATSMENAKIEKGEYTASREYGGAKFAKKFKAEGVILTDVAEIARRCIVLAPAGKYALRTIDPLTDCPQIESLEVSTPEKRREQEVVVALLSSPRSSQMKEYVMDPKGALLEISGKANSTSFKKATKAEAESVIKKP